MEQRRGPLIPQTNSNPRPLPIKPLRRKSSFISRVDSSEEMPNSHESIFMAEYLSSNSEDSSHKIELHPIQKSTAPNHTDDIDASRSISPSVGNTVIKYGHGTPLTTIVEQKSRATLRTVDSEMLQTSGSELAVASTTSCLLGHRNSLELPSTVTLRIPRRRKSFSADDLILIKHSYHKACSTIELSTRRLRPVNKIYAEPRAPVIPPLERPSTPPGMPSWTAAQNAPTRSQNQRQTQIRQGKQGRVRRLLGLQPSSTKIPSRDPVPPALRSSVQPAERRDRRLAAGPQPFSIVAPRFRPPRSGHGTGPVELHPFLTSRSSNMKGEDLQAQLGSPQPLPSNPRIRSQIPSGPSIVGERFLVRNAKRETRKGRQASFMRPMRDTRLKCRSVIGSNTNDSNMTRRKNKESAGAPINGSKQCPHCQKRIACFWSVSNNTDRIPSPCVSSMSTGCSVVSPRYIDHDATRQRVNLAPIPETRYERGAVTPAAPQGTNAILSFSNSAYRPAQEHIQNVQSEVQRCWKCRVKTLVQRIDLCLEVPTRRWCWICCGVDMDNDDEAIPCRSSQEPMMTIARRATLESTPVIAF